MEIRTLTDQHLMNSPLEELARFQVATAAEAVRWEAQLRESPDSQKELEKQIDQHFRNGAGLLFAALIALTSLSSEIQNVVAQIQGDATTSLRKPHKVKRMIRLMCGLLLEITTLYCVPACGGVNHDDENHVEIRQGLYPELAAFAKNKLLYERSLSGLGRALALRSSRFSNLLLKV